MILYYIFHISLYTGALFAIISIAGYSSRWLHYSRLINYFVTGITAIATGNMFTGLFSISLFVLFHSMRKSL